MRAAGPISVANLLSFVWSVSSRSSVPIACPIITCQSATQSFRATATAALFRPRRAASASPHFCSGLFTSRSFLPDWMEPFARTIDAAKKYVVSSTPERVDWNAELVRGDLGEAVQQLKREPGKGLLVGGVKLPLALAELGLIDEYEFVVQPRLAGHGPTLFAGLSKRVDLKLVSRLEFDSGMVAMRYEPVAVLPG